MTQPASWAAARQTYERKVAAGTFDAETFYVFACPGCGRARYLIGAQMADAVTRRGRCGRCDEPPTGGLAWPTNTRRD